MIFSFDLLINAIVSGILIGGFYAAVTSGVTLSFGILDIVNIAHPAFIILGSYIAYIANATLGVDPILASIVMMPLFFVLGSGIYQVYYVSFEKRGQESLRGLAFFSACCSLPKSHSYSISASTIATSRLATSVHHGTLPCSTYPCGS
jgi:branched-chain amino acid transport system permease protein